MNLDNLESLSVVIKRYGLLGNKIAAKKLSQNFLLDANITDKIARAAGDLTKSCLIEVGPGPGGLTRSLLRYNPLQICAIERDNNCIKALGSLVEASEGRLTLVASDALKILPQSLSNSNLPIKIVANLPYSIGTQLLLKWLKNLDRIVSLTLMFQREVGLRIVAAPGTSSYGRLSIICQYLCHVEKLFDLPPQVFTPQPKVFSSVINLYPKFLTDSELNLIPKLERLTATVFCQRRKMIRKSLSGHYPQEYIDQALRDIGRESTERPENLNLGDYTYLAKTLPFPQTEDNK